MPRFSELEDEFICPYRDSCPYLEGLPARWVWERHNQSVGLECHYEYQLKELYQQLDEADRKQEELQRENEQLKAQLHALHRRQFKGRRVAVAAAPTDPAGEPKRRGAPVGHAPWQRPKPKRIDRVIEVPAPTRCPDCRALDLRPLPELRPHLQEDIVLEPRTLTTCYLHHQAHCPTCDRPVLLAGPAELLGSYIGPAAKATEIYLRQELHISYRKISRFFTDFFGLKFVPASAYGFERQAVRRGRPLYEDLRQKIQALSVAHADETSWRHDGRPYWVWYAGSNDLGFFHLDPHRSAVAAQSVLGERFSGTIVADAFGSYKGVHPKDWQSCLAHIKTKAKELEQELALLKGQAADPGARQFCQDVQGFVHHACQAHQRLARGRWRAKAAQRKAAALRRELQRICHRPLRYPKAEAFRQRLRGPEQKHFFTCFRRPGVPPTNNQAERSLRPVVIMRKIIQGTRSPHGLENHSVLRSLFETARRQGKKPHSFFLDLFTRPTAQAHASLYRKPLSQKPRPPQRC